MKKVFYTLFSFIILILDVQASHLVGGTIIYECTGGNQYKFTVIRYRDCAPGSVPMINRPLILNPKGGGSNITVNLTLITTSTIPPPQTNPCLVPPATLCRMEYIYQANNVIIPNSFDGYNVYFGDCCRPGGMTNILSSASIGQTITIQIPDPGKYPCNSSPVFVNTPPTVVCVNDSVVLDHSAIDPDGDSLSYYLCNSLNGSNQSPPPSFPVVPYSSSYSGTYPIASSPAFAINATTGIFSGTPVLPGTYAYKVCIDEWRNGKKIGSYQREVDMTVVNCPNVTASIKTDYNSLNLGISVVASCDDSTVSFKNSSISGSSAIYFWDFGVDSISTDTSSLKNPTYTYPDTGTYTVMLIVNPGYGCSDTAYQTVIIYPTIIVDFNWSSPRCAGQPIQFLDSSSTAYGYVNYWHWSFGNGFYSSGQNPFITYSTKSSYNVRLIIESSKGCRDTIIKSVVVYDLPVVSAGPDKHLCTVDSVQLQGSVTNVTSGYTTSWSPSAGLNDSTILTPYASPSDTTSYFLTISSTLGCVVTDTVTVFINSISIDAGNNRDICTGDTVQLQGDSPTPGLTYSWSPSGSLSDSNIAKPKAWPLVATVYTITVRDTVLGCSGKDSILITVSPLPIVNAGSDVKTCFGDSIQLGGSGGVGYHWSPAKYLNNPFIPDPIAFPDSNTTFILEVVDSNGCQGIDSIYVTILPLPPIPTITQTGNQLTSSAITGNQWYESGKIIPGETNQVFFPTKNGTYTVVITDSNGCSSESLPFDFILTSIGSNLFEYGLKIFPNPSSGDFIIQSNFERPIVFEITDISGKKVYKTDRVIKGNNKIIVSDFNKGVYLLIFVIDGVYRVEKLIVE
jgi:PKD repeat protein